MSSRVVDCTTAVAAGSGQRRWGNGCCSYKLSAPLLSLK